MGMTYDKRFHYDRANPDSISSTNLKDIKAIASIEGVTPVNGDIEFMIGLKIYGDDSTNENNFDIFLRMVYLIRNYKSEINTELLFPLYKEGIGILISEFYKKADSPPLSQFKIPLFSEEEIKNSITFCCRTYNFKIQGL